MPIMSLRHVSPRSKAPPPPPSLQQSNSISSERDYHYHTKHSYDPYNTTNNTTTHYYLIDKPYKHNKSKYNNVYLSHNKLFDILNVTNDRRNHQFLKQTTSKLDTSIDTYSIPSKLRSMQNYGASVSSVNNCTTNTTTTITTTTTTTITTTTTNNSNNMSKESFENSNLKNRYSKSIHCQSPIIHVRNHIHHISNHSNNNNGTINHNRLNDGFNFLKHVHKSKKYLNIRQYSINNSYDDVINLNKLTDSNHYLCSV
ncbi:unnamed protein product, partial [Schistosoma curassoni]